MQKFVKKMEEELAEYPINIHGYLLLQGRTAIAEKYWEPYSADSLHRMYSVTKSFAAIAIGLLCREGKVSLEDSICKYFLEKLPPEGVHPWCQEMTIKDLLTMRTCYASTTYKRYEGQDWTESFFHVKPDHIPGTVFSYDTSAAHVLSALTEKLTGEKLLDYLRQKAFDRIGFSKEAYILEDPVGISQGGSGLMCTLRDLGAVAYLCNHYGILEGEELLPLEYMRQATANQVPTDLQPVPDEQQGYGYCFWMPGKEGFVMYGMGGQLALCFPKKDVCFVTMADTIGDATGVARIYDSFYRNIYPHLTDRPAENPRAFQEPPTEQEFSKPRTGRERYEFYENEMGWQEIEFDWGQSAFILKRGKESYRFGKEKEMTFPGTKYRCSGKQIWKQGHFIAEYRVTDEEQGHMSVDIAWKDSRLSLRMNSTGEPFFEGMKGFASARLIADAE